MLDFTVRWLYPLRNIPFAPLVLDLFLKIHVFIFKPQLLGYIDEIEKELNSWSGVSTRLHKYGGIEFCADGNEIGHIHSNGLLDILFSKEIKAELKKIKKILDHHKFPESGWVSFYIKDSEDKMQAIELLKYSYEIRALKSKTGNDREEFCLVQNYS